MKFLKDNWISLFAIQSTLAVWVVMCLLDHQTYGAIILCVAMAMYRIIIDCQRISYYGTQTEVRIFF
jgi:hypothetical protein